MEKPVKRPRKSLTQSLTDRMDEKVEQIVYKVMTNEGLEHTINKAVQKSLVTLVRRYFILVAIGVVLLLFIQAVFISLAIKV